MDGSSRGLRGSGRRSGVRWRLAGRAARVAAGVVAWSAACALVPAAERVPGFAIAQGFAATPASAGAPVSVAAQAAGELRRLHGVRPRAERDRSIDSAVVSTDAGPVEGVVLDGYRKFLGIPFAAPPVGELRWQPPQEHARWSAPRAATSFASSCPQASSFGQTYDASEDCLYLNVFAPRTRRTDLPVMVWFHGGGFTGGTTSQYDAALLATEGQVVVVTAAYRLNVFGFLAHPALGSEESTSGSFGIQDQQAALRWVQRNAAVFGGDPSRVTVFGESAGSMSVCAHLASPDSAGLLHRAIMQSGACSFDMRTQPEAEEDGERLAEKLGCTGAGAANCLREKSTQELLDASGTVGSPAVGGTTLPVQPGEALETGRFNRVPVIVGANHDEYRFFVAQQVAAGKSLSAEEYAQRIEDSYGEHAEAVLAEYPASDFADPDAALGTVLTDYGTAISLCSVLATDRAAARWVRTYAYEFADFAAPAIPLPGFAVGPVHANELQYLGFFGENGFGFDDDQWALARQMRRYWTQFADTGNPNAAGWPRWPELRSDADVQWLEPGRGGIHPYDLSAEHRCAFWESLYGSLYGS